MMSEYMNLFIKLQYERYCKEIRKIPKLKSVIVVNNFDDWAKFESEDLYKCNYILYIDSELENEPNEFIEQILFHEFTHISDSLRFKMFSFEKFKSIMKIYSEIYASKIQMDRMLLTESHKPYTLDQEVVYGGILTLKSFMDQTYDKLKSEFMIPEGFITTTNLKFDLNKLYYYIGFLKSLKSNNIKYVQQLNEIKVFGNLFKEVCDYVLNNKVNIDVLYKYEKELTKLIKDTIEMHNKTFCEDIVNKVLQ